MSDKKISYLSRNFEDYKRSLKEFVKKYYPKIANDFNDASIGTWLIEIVAAVADNLSFHLDRTFSEVQIDTASEASSVYSIARNNGFKIPGPRPAVAEETFSCIVPVYTDKSSSNDPSLYGMPMVNLMPVIKRGTKLYSGSQYFEVMEDIDFSEQFNANGYSDRTMYANKNSAGNTTSYTITKKALIVGGQSKVYTRLLSDSDITPFMEFILPDKNILSIESIIFKDGTYFEVNPSMSEFMTPNEYSMINKQEILRYFEVNSLTDQYRWGDDTKPTDTTNGEATVYTYGFNDVVKDTIIPTSTAVKGEWIPITQKFMTEYTDNGYLKVIFGCGEQVGAIRDYYCDMSDFNKYQVSRMIRNNFLGKLPKGGTTMYVLYRVGGGESSNVAANTITAFSKLNVDFPTCYNTNAQAKDLATIKNSITCTNELPSVSGKDAPSIDEIRSMIKYHNSAQERCVTVKDYEERLLLMPSRYGTPFRVSVVEENNKVMIYILGIDNNGYLSDKLPVVMVQNIENYLSRYRSINDFVEIKNGRIVNISIEMDLFVDKNYTVEGVLLEVNNTIKEYMSINKHQMGSDIYVGDIERVVGNVPGVLNVIDTRIFNECGEGYSKTMTTQAIVDDGEISRTSSYEFDLLANQYMLNGETDEMFEIKYPERDIRIKVMQR